VEDAALPVTVIDRSEIERQGSPAILDVIRSLSLSHGTVGEANAGGVLHDPFFGNPIGRVFELGLGKQFR
jgi:hypothetical protein